MNSSDNTVWAIARKETMLFFNAPTGYLFLLAYLASTLFVFFWGEAFFARNIADVRPMFEWLPVLLIFLSAALTMRMWSEEKRAGTLEFVITVPAREWQFVAGKFSACLMLLIIALLMTLPLVMTVSLISNLDWGPVFAGYVAAILLGGAYIAIGLYFSARTDNQIVALIITAFVCGCFYMIGSGFFAGLFGNDIGSLLRSLGTGSRFESITRGLLDVRDLAYYLSLGGVFLVLCVHVLTSQGWSSRAGGRIKVHAVTVLLVANILMVNFWLAGIHGLRWDVTEGNQYSISEGTKAWLDQLREPLLIRGYFSTKTHPLLAPLVPQLKDLLKEYEIAAGSRVRLELIDPAEHPELEDEANTKYGIRPVPFQVSDRYQSSVVNSYFNVLLQYGDEYEVLSFSDLIEIKARGEGNLEVRLRNPEFDITRSIKKALQSYRSSGDVFENISQAVAFQGYISADEQLPQQLHPIKKLLDTLLAEFVAAAKGKFTVSIVDPQAGDGSVAKQIQKDHGFSPMQMSLLATQRFYFYLTLNDGHTLVQVPLPAEVNEASLKGALEDGLKRFGVGVLHRVAMQTPVSQEAERGGGQSYTSLRNALSNDFQVESTEQPEPVKPGANTGVLILLSPQQMTPQELFAADQFLMRGGMLIIAAGAFDIALQQNFRVTPKDSGLDEWLKSHGVSIEKAFVLDSKNTKFPVPTSRRVGRFTFQEIQMLDYPYFIDVRDARLNQEFSPLSALPQVTLAWAAPIEVDEQANQARQITTLMRSSSNAWRSSSLSVTPQAGAGSVNPFSTDGELRSHSLAVMIEGRFNSFFEEVPPPPEAAEDAEPEGDATQTERVDEYPTGVIKRSPESARLIVIGSDASFNNEVLGVLSSAGGSVYTNSTQMIVNLVEWAAEDLTLLSIRGRGHFNRTLPPFEENEQQKWEYVNYGVAVVMVALCVLLNVLRRAYRRRHQLLWLQEGQKT